MKKLLLALSVLLVLISVSCDSDPYIVGQVKNEKELRNALAEAKDGDSILIKAGSYTFDSDLEISKDMTLYVEGGKAAFNFTSDKAGVVATKELGNGDLTISNIDINGKLTINGGGSNSIYLENSDVAEVVLDKEIIDSTTQELPRLVIKGDTKITTLDIKEEGVLDITESKVEGNPIDDILVQAAVEEVIVVGDITKIEEALGDSNDKVKTGVARIGNEYYSTFDEALANAISGDTVTLLDDVGCGSSEEFLSYNIALDKNLVVDLNNKQLTLYLGVTQESKVASISIEGSGVSVEIKNGTIKTLSNKGSDTTGSLFVKNGAKLTLNKVTFESYGSALCPTNESELNIINDSRIIAHGSYGVATNNTYGTGIKINIEDSLIDASLCEKKYGTALCLNTNATSTITVSNSTLRGQIQSVMVRGFGYAIFDSVTFDFKDEWDGEDFNETKWKSGNCVASAPIVIGSDKADSYTSDSIVTIKGDSKILVPNEYTGDYIYMRGRSGFTTTLDTKEATGFDTVVTVGFDSTGVKINNQEISSVGKYFINNGELQDGVLLFFDDFSTDSTERYCPYHSGPNENQSAHDNFIKTFKVNTEKGYAEVYGNSAWLQITDLDYANGTKYKMSYSFSFDGDVDHIGTEEKTALTFSHLTTSWLNTTGFRIEKGDGKYLVTKGIHNSKEDGAEIKSDTQYKVEATVFSPDGGKTLNVLTQVLDSENKVICSDENNNGQALKNDFVFCIYHPEPVSDKPIAYIDDMKFEIVE